MNHRFGKPGPGVSGKRPTLPHTGLGSVARQDEGQWQIDVRHRRVGSVIRRDIFSVTIRRESPLHEEFLTGFPSRQAAEAAARERIDLLEYCGRRVRARPSRNRPVL